MLDEHSTVPRNALEFMLEAYPDSFDEISDKQMIWLAHLAEGKTVAELAKESFVSERAMYRELHDLYRTLGVENKAHAIAKASRMSRGEWR